MFDTEEMKEIIEKLSAVIEETAPKTAKAIRALFDALKNEGFSEEQALSIVSRMNLVGSGK